MNHLSRFSKICNAILLIAVCLCALMSCGAPIIGSSGEYDGTYAVTVDEMTSTLDIQGNKVTLRANQYISDSEMLGRDLGIDISDDTELTRFMAFTGKCVKAEDEKTVKVDFTAVKIGLEISGKDAETVRNAYIASIEEQVKEAQGKPGYEDEIDVNNALIASLKNGELIDFAVVNGVPAPDVTATFMLDKEAKTACTLYLRIVEKKADGSVFSTSETYYDENGNVIDSKTKHGDEKNAEYYPDGTVKRTVSYNENGHIELESEYFESGKLKIETAYYDNGQINARQTFFESGTLFKQENYEANGDPIHEITYDENGEEIRQVLYSGGQKKFESFIDGKQKISIEYAGDGVISRKKTVSENGERVSERYDQSGNLSEKEIHAENGESISELYDQNGKPIHKERRAKNGNPIDIFDYTDGVLRMKCIYGEDGNLLEEDYYDENGILNRESLHYENGNQKKLAYYDENGNVDSESLYYENGNRQREIRVSKTEAGILREEIYYDDNNNPLKRVVYDGDGKLLSESNFDGSEDSTSSTSVAPAAPESVG